MSIKIQVEDAKFLAENGRHLGALTNLMLAVAASSRKTFPKGKTKSLKDPSKKMGDSEAFTLFIGGRIRKILFGDFGGSETGNSGISVNFKNKQYDIAFILYKFYRCELVHEGELPEDIEFSPPRESMNLGMSNNGVSVSVSCGNTMVLDYGWIDLLVESVVSARCNGKTFGIQHFEMHPATDISDDGICKIITEKYNTSPGRFHILKEAAYHIQPSIVIQSNDEELRTEFSKLVYSGIINRGAITGLSSHNLTDRSGNITDIGIEIIRYISVEYELVEITS
ncbi:hypothetical protein AMS58_19950 [Pseudoalteromonas porphyrae]|uniref:hypothetical protein n=1 Tax=Pseudoalteromonas TaxID=53246 RepID=UPI0006BABD3A|nr:MULTISPECIES: hypothetical protein [Pseudoalteromonas]KPH92915.1 hypothetical protein AMS58_19950 [Pseudoalteromonas porphyrae]